MSPLWQAPFRITLLNQYLVVSFTQSPCCSFLRSPSDWQCKRPAGQVGSFREAYRSHAGFLATEMKKKPYYSMDKNLPRKHKLRMMSKPVGRSVSTLPPCDTHRLTTFTIQTPNSAIISGWFYATRSEFGNRICSWFACDCLRCASTSLVIITA